MRRWLQSGARIGALATLALLAPAHAAAPGGVTDVVRIPLERQVGPAGGMVAGIYAPQGAGPFPVVVYSHGRSPDRSETDIPDPRGFVRYFVHKGFVVVAPIRPGYGATGGTDRENSGVLIDMFGNCWGQPRFDTAAAAAREALTAAIDWIRTQPWADATRIVLVGTSMGGLASVATAAANVRGVTGYINFAGGTGGSGEASPEHSCGSADMESLMARYGTDTHVPSLWLYAQNDRFWGEERPKAWHRAFAAGGSNTRFIETAAVPHADGHQLLGRGSRLWMAPVDRFLADLGF